MALIESLGSAAKVGQHLCLADDRVGLVHAGSVARLGFELERGLEEVDV